MNVENIINAKRSKIGTFSKISLITNVIIKSFPQVINILWKTLLYSYQEILKMSCLCGLLDCEKPVESVFYRISIYKNKYSNYQVFLDFIMFTQYNQFCVLKFFI